MRESPAPNDSGSEPEFVAAADLGSNSFHLVIARLDSGRLVVVDCIKEIVRLGGGLDSESNLTRPAQLRALDCLGRFGQRLRDVPASNIRAVGTNTFRKARNIEKFLPEAEKALGHSIDVITGREEARLIYESVCYGLSDNNSKQLVIDIGGGSTEVIVGTGHYPHLVESLYIGCVSLTEAKFPDGRITPERLLQADLESQLEVRAIHRQFRDQGWNKVLGCSGTIRAVADVLQLLNLGNGTIERNSLFQLRDKILRCKHTSELANLGFEASRCEVLPGGFAIVCALFQLLQIDTMEVSDLALREGVLYDLLGRLRNNDARQRTVESLAEHWSIDNDHAQRVRNIALDMYDQVEDDWFRDAANSRNLLDWAASLHEIGLSVAHTKYHEHGAYLLEFSDMAGFSRPEQSALATLVRHHRRKLPDNFADVSTSLRKAVLWKLCVILRLAVLLHRPRTDRIDLLVECTVNKNKVMLNFPENWLNHHPLTRADLIQEYNYLKKAGFMLQISE